MIKYTSYNIYSTKYCKNIVENYFLSNSFISYFASAVKYTNFSLGNKSIYGYSWKWIPQLSDNNDFFIYCLSFPLKDVKVNPKGFLAFLFEFYKKLYYTQDLLNSISFICVCHSQSIIIRYASFTFYLYISYYVGLLTLCIFNIKGDLRGCLNKFLLADEFNLLKILILIKYRNWKFKSFNLIKKYFYCFRFKFSI